MNNEKRPVKVVLLGCGRAGHLGLGLAAHAEAAGRRVALSSGGKVVAVIAAAGRPDGDAHYAQVLAEAAPDVVLLAGGDPVHRAIVSSDVPRPRARRWSGRAAAPVTFAVTVTVTVALGLAESDFTKDVWQAGIYKDARYGIPLDIHLLGFYAITAQAIEMPRKPATKETKTSSFQRIETRIGTKR